METVLPCVVKAVYASKGLGRISMHKVQRTLEESSKDFSDQLIKQGHSKKNASNLAGTDIIYKKKQNAFTPACIALAMQGKYKLNTYVFKKWKQIGQQNIKDFLSLQEHRGAHFIAFGTLRNKYTDTKDVLRYHLLDGVQTHDNQYEKEISLWYHCLCLHIHHEDFSKSSLSCSMQSGRLPISLLRLPEPSGKSLIS